MNKSRNDRIISDIMVVSNMLKSLDADEGVGRRGVNCYNAALNEPRGQNLPPSVSPVFRPDSAVLLSIAWISVIAGR